MIGSLFSFLCVVGIGVLVGWMFPQPAKAKPLTDWLAVKLKALWVKITNM